MQVRDACVSSSPHTLSKRLNANLPSFDDLDDLMHLPEHEDSSDDDRYCESYGTG